MKISITVLEKEPYVYQTEILVPSGISYYVARDMVEQLEKAAIHLRRHLPADFQRDRILKLLTNEAEHDQ